MISTDLSTYLSIYLSIKSRDLGTTRAPNNLSWWHSIVVKTAGSAGVLSLFCARLTAGRVTTLWVKHPLSVSQQGRLSLPSLRGR